MCVWGWNAVGLQVKQEAWGQKPNLGHFTHQLSLSLLKQSFLWVNQFPVTRTEFSVPRLSLQLPTLQLYKGIQYFCYLKIKATLQPLWWVNQRGIFQKQPWFFLCWFIDTIHEMNAAPQGEHIAPAKLSLLRQLPLWSPLGLWVHSCKLLSVSKSLVHLQLHFK